VSASAARVTVNLQRRGVLACAGAATGWLLGAAPAPLAAQEDVPFVTTPDRVTLEMLKLAQVGADDFVIDLGSGDGRIVVTAAKVFGARGLGVDIVPELVERSRAAARRAGVADRVEFRVQDLFETDLSAATVVTLYLLPEVNLKLRPRLQALKPGTRIVSHDWDMGDWRPDRTVVVDAPDKPVGHEKSSRLHLWTVSAPRVDRPAGREDTRGLAGSGRTLGVTPR
jgi:SAM-dependent methyltransferase